MIDLNFFSNKIRKKKSFRNKMIISVGILASVVLLIGSVYGAMQLRANMYKKDIKSMTEYLESDTVKQRKTELEYKKKKLNIIKKYNDAVLVIANNIDSSDTIKSQFVELVNTTIPKNIVIESFAFTTQTISIQGKSQRRTEIAELSHNLKELRVFDNVHVASIREEEQQQGLYSFDIKCTLKEVTKP